MNSLSKDDGILLEIARIGNVLRVAALDPDTLAEVTFQAPPATDRKALVALARRKLDFVTARMVKSGNLSRS
ncbi:MAG: DUF6898 family protein [Geminicoccaceae bacterium]